jgi:hypothetical protein
LDPEIAGDTHHTLHPARSSGSVACHLEIPARNGSAIAVRALLNLLRTEHSRLNAAPSGGRYRSFYGVDLVFLFDSGFIREGWVWICRLPDSRTVLPNGVVPTGVPWSKSWTPLEVPTFLKAPPRGRAQPAYEWRIRAVEYDAGRS